MASSVCSPAVALLWSAGHPFAGQPQVFGASEVSPKLQLLLYAELSVVQKVSLDGFCPCVDNTNRIIQVPIQIEVKVLNQE